MTTKLIKTIVTLAIVSICGFAFAEDRTALNDRIHYADNMAYMTAFNASKVSEDAVAKNDRIHYADNQAWIVAFNSSDVKEDVVARNDRIHHADNEAWMVAFNSSKTSVDAVAVNDAIHYEDTKTWIVQNGLEEDPMMRNDRIHLADNEAAMEGWKTTGTELELLTAKK